MSYNIYFSFGINKALLNWIKLNWIVKTDFIYILKDINELFLKTVLQYYHKDKSILKRPFVGHKCTNQATNGSALTDKSVVDCVACAASHIKLNHQCDSVTASLAWSEA